MGDGCYLVWGRSAILYGDGCYLVWGRSATLYGGWLTSYIGKKCYTVWGMAAILYGEGVLPCMGDGWYLVWGRSATLYGGWLLSCMGKECYPVWGMAILYGEEVLPCMGKGTSWLWVVLYSVAEVVLAAKILLLNLNMRFGTSILIQTINAIKVCANQVGWPLARMTFTDLYINIQSWVEIKPLMLWASLSHPQWAPAI